jgi:hypothetical protein
MLRIFYYILFIGCIRIERTRLRFFIRIFIPHYIYFEFNIIEIFYDYKSCI